MKDENKILKWFDNELSINEIDDLKESKNFKKIEKIAHYSSQMTTPKIDAEAALRSFRSKNIEKGKVRTLNIQKYLKYAAVLVLMVCITFITFFNKEITYNTAVAETEIIVLPDNSQVTLNAFSELSYNKKKWKEERNLELNGEAFFKVSKGEKFTVKTALGDIQVLGTQFNVKKRDDYFEVQCYEGLVGVMYNGKNIKLSKGKTFRVVDSKIELVEDFSSLKPSWLMQESTFIKVPLKYVIMDLENYYNIKIVAQNVDLERLYTGTFTHNNKTIAIKSIAIPLNLKYKTEGNTITLYQNEN